MPTLNWIGKEAKEMALEPAGSLWHHADGR
jgi:hypothetical protein